MLEQWLAYLLQTNSNHELLLPLFANIIHVIGVDFCGKVAKISVLGDRSRYMDPIIVNTIGSICESYKKLKELWLF